ncbi:MAG: phosphotyrosine protein phosphatase, partial [Burkholderiaceae bacterium]|nr:phosphotyrosine protein phosphatase [Burkholderiaceae bacterium]
MKTRVLFVCSQNRLRSPTGEQVFSQFPELDCQSAGTDISAKVPLTVEHIQWADFIFAMEKNHKKRIMSKFKTHVIGKRVFVLGIPDNYDFM